jgi:1-acyl-sn-glycerol-3-phosphate acyltransferase
MMLFWGIVTSLAALVMFPYTLITSNVEPIYWVAMWIAFTGVRVAGIKVTVIGLDRLDSTKRYVFMSNHTSAMDPPLLIPLIPTRTSVLVKKELFRVPVLGQAMRLGQLVPVDRSNREKAIESLQRAQRVLNDGVNMTIFVEGTRSPDGRLLPFKKGPFYLACDTGHMIVPVTIAGTHELLPKGKFFARPGKVTVHFHDPIDPANVPDRDQLMAAVRERIASALPENLRNGELTR